MLTVVCLAFILLLALLGLTSISNRRYLRGFQALLASPEGLSPLHLHIIDRALDNMPGGDPCLKGEYEPDADEESEPDQVPRVLVVPRERTRALLVLWDAYTEACRSYGPASTTARFDLWEEARDIFPEVGVGTWAIDANDACPRFVEVL